MRTLRLVCFALLVASGCSKTDKTDKTAGAPAKASGGALAWQPDGMDKLTPACLKALACCEAVLAAKQPSATASDYNLACSAPASGIWKDADCTADVKSQAAELGDKLPAACK